MVTIDDMIQQIEERIRLHEQIRQLFETGEMTLYHGREVVPREDCIAQEARFIEQDRATISALRELKVRGRLS